MPIAITLMADYILLQINSICNLLCFLGLKVIPEVRRQVRRLEAKYIAIKQIRDIKEQIEELKKERVWAEVIENEKVNYMYDVKTKQHHVLLFVPCK